MYPMDRLRVEWSGSNTTGLGLSTFYFAGASGDPTAIYNFFNTIKGAFAANIAWNIPNNGDVIDSETGDLVGAWTGTGGGLVTSTGSGVFTRGAGARVVWNTAGIFRGRRVRGSTFLTGLYGGAYDGNGNVGSAALTNFTTAATALLAATSPNLGIWSRPNDGTPGEFNSITSSTVPTSTSWLRSRRT
jgi:hypothetical protein